MPQLAGRKNEMSGALWLIGLGVLFLTGSFWLGILVLIGLTGTSNLVIYGQPA